MITRRSHSCFSVVATMFFLLCAPGAWADDHVDAPRVIDNPSLDITGLYAFKNPKNGEKLVLVLTLNAHQQGTVAQADLFNADAKYSFYVDNNSDAVAETTINFYFQKGIKRYAVFINSEPVIGAAFAEIATRDATRVFAGRSNDPFFMDYEGFANFVDNFCNKDGGVSGRGFRCASTGKPENYYTKFNVGVLAVELPIARLTRDSSAVGGTLQIWAKTFQIKTSRQH